MLKVQVAKGWWWWVNNLIINSRREPNENYAIKIN